MQIKSLIRKIRMVPSSICNSINMHLRHYSIGKGVTIYGGVFIRGTGKVSIGDNVIITSCRETNPIGGETKTVIYAKTNSKIEIGANTGISNSAIVAMNEIIIEENVFIGGGCKIYDNDFHSLVFEERMMSPDPGVKSAPVRIKKRAFIGAHSIILKGVTIGEKSIVGAGSVVAKDIPDGQIWAGNPAKYIRNI